MFLCKLVVALVVLGARAVRGSPGPAAFWLDGVAVGEGRPPRRRAASRARSPISGRCGCSGFRLADFNRRESDADADPIVPPG